MSPAQGCFVCQVDPSTYSSCQRLDCPKRRTTTRIKSRIADLDAAPRERVTNVIQVTEPGYDVVLFFNDDGGAEAVISRPNDKPTGVNIAPPAPGRRIVVERTGDRFAVVYRDAPK